MRALWSDPGVVQVDIAAAASTSQSAVSQALADLAVRSPKELVLETRADPVRGFAELDAKDNILLQPLLTKEQVPPGVALRHADKSEPLLWLPDVVAGARTDHLCAVDRDLFPLIAHRVRRIAIVLGD